MDVKTLITSFVNGSTQGRASSVYIENNVIYSYGSHFPMGIRLNDGTFVVNISRFSQTTSKQQNLLIDALQSHYKSTRYAETQTMIALVRAQGDEEAFEQELAKTSPIEIKPTCAGIVKQSPSLTLFRRP